MKRKDLGISFRQSVDICEKKNREPGKKKKNLQDRISSWITANSVCTKWTKALRLYKQEDT